MKTESGWPRCQQRIWAGHRGQMCSRAATVGDRCTQHSPAYIEARKKKNGQRQTEKVEGRRRAYRNAYAGSYILALQKIAKGCKNPERVAKRALREVES